MSVGRIHLAQDRVQLLYLVNMVMNLRVPQQAGKFLTSCASISFSWSLLYGGRELL
jgi:hypothetical protein